MRKRLRIFIRVLAQLIDFKQARSGCPIAIQGFSKLPGGSPAICSPAWVLAVVFRRSSLVKRRSSTTNNRYLKFFDRFACFIRLLTAPAGILWSGSTYMEADAAAISVFP
jgi:hypothetical protein